MRGLTSCAKSTASTTARFSFRAEGAVIDEAIFAQKIELVGGRAHWRERVPFRRRAACGLRQCAPVARGLGGPDLGGTDSDVAQGAEGDLPCLLEALVGGERHYQNEVSILIGCSLVFPLKIETSF